MKIGSVADWPRTNVLIDFAVPMPKWLMLYATGATRSIRPFYNG